MTDHPTTTLVRPDTQASLRAAMVETQIRRRGIRDERVLQVLARVPRHEFVAAELRHRAHDDVPLPIGSGQTISQPYMVAAMTAALQLDGTERILEIGTGCGYQTAVLSELAQEVFTIELREDLATEAHGRLRDLGYRNIRALCGDGSLGWPEFAPFDAILVAAAAPFLPLDLVGQLAEGGRMIVPVGGATQQDLLLATRRGGGFVAQHLEGCRFVPLRGRYGWKESEIA